MGTIFENTNYPLRIWFQVIYLMCQSKKGVSALQIQRTIGSGSYRTAWYMCHRIRCAMQNDEFKKLSGVVEVDEPYIGGEGEEPPRTRHRPRNQEREGRDGGTGKIAVVGAISRKGNVVAKIIERTDERTLSGFVRETVGDNVSLVATDEHPSYRALNSEYPHQSVSARARASMFEAKSTPERLTDSGVC